MAAIIPAAGRARRFGGSKNKIWARIAGRSVLEWTLTAFQAHPEIASIVLVAGEEEIERVRSISANFSKVAAVVIGGATRTESVRNGLEAVPEGTRIVLVHDAARPLVTAEVITGIVEATDRVGGAVPGFPLSDTVKRADSEGIVRATVPRSAEIDGVTLSGLTAVQTPQGAQAHLLREAYARYDFAGPEPTDEAALLEFLGASVAVVPGDPTNIKITRPEDVLLAEKLIAARHGISTAAPAPENSFPEYRTGLGYDVHAFSAPEAGRKLFLGGVEIPHDRGLEGHSDADVLLHAVCDALLGAASLGDIGILFPNTDDAFKNIASLKLLSVCGERVTEAGWTIVNIDATVLAEAPKLMPYREAMMRAIGERLSLDPGRVSIKATTSEQMGFVGRREGIASWAVASIRKP